MPKAVLDKINAGVNQALGESDIQARLATFCFEGWRGSSADVTRAALADSESFEKIVKDSEISLD